MKHILVSLIILMTTCIVSLAGNDDKKSESAFQIDGKKVTITRTTQNTTSTDIRTSYIYVDKEGNEYPIYLHDYVKGDNAGKTTCYIWKISKKTGKEYKYYLPNGVELADKILSQQ